MVALSCWVFSLFLARGRKWPARSKNNCLSRIEFAARFPKLYQLVRLQVD